MFRTSPGPSSEGLTIYTTLGILLFCIASCLVCFLVDYMFAGPTDSQLKSTTHTNCCIYTAYLLM